MHKAVAADTDLTYRVSAGGLKEEVILGSASAPTSFRFHLSDPKGALGAASPMPGGGYRFANKVDDATVELPAAFAYEQRSAKADGGGALMDLSSASMTLTEAGDGWDLTVSVNPQWLAGKSFPIILDPTIAFSNGNAYDGTYANRPNFFPGCPGCGALNGGDPGGGTGTYHDPYVDMEPTRTAFRFDLSTIPAGSKVSAASLNLYLAACIGNSNYYCDQHSYPVEVHAFTADWTAGNATWDSLLPITAPGNFGTYTQPPFVTSQPAPPINMTTSQVQSWVNGANYGFSLMLPPQPANWGGPYYASSDNPTYPHPTLSVTYAATAPGWPTSVSATAGNSSAQVTWTPPASNGGSPVDSYAVNVFDPDGTYTGIQAQVCGTCTSATIGGLTNGRAYYFGVYAHNSVDYSIPTYSGFQTPAVPPGAPTSLQGSVSTGWYHSLIGRPDGTVTASGLNNVGQLGNNTTVDAKVPTVVPGLSGVTQVEAGYAHSLALKADGTVWAWGYNNAGELGNNTTVDSPVPVQVPGLSGVVSISTSCRHNLAVKSDGTVWAWGYNSNGQLGNNSTVNSLVPIQVPNLSPSLTKMVGVSAGYLHSLTLREDGRVLAFGLNNYGQLGNNSTVESRTAVMVANVGSAVAISAGVAHNLVVRGDGAVWAFGYNAYGALGNNTTVNSSVATLVPGLTGVTSVSAHGGYDSMARKTNGSLWGWGYNANGQLGNNTTTQSNVPVQLPGQAGVTQASAGIYHTMAVKAGGGITASGYNAQGQLGNNTLIDTLAPVTPAGPGVAAQSAFLAAVGGGGTVDVTWAAPVSTGGRPFTGYTLILFKGAPGSGVVAASQSCLGPCASATFAGLEDNASYYVSVAAITGAGTGPAATSNPTTTSMALAGAGERDYFSFTTTQITDRVTAKVNIGTGNLEVTSAELSVPVVGGARPLGHVFNSLGLAPGAAGLQSTVAGGGWRFNDAPDLRLIPNTDGSVTFISGSGNPAIFAAGTLTAPPGLDATLVRQTDGTWKMTFLHSATKLTFRADGMLIYDADRNSNTVAVTYPPGGSAPSSIVGTAGTAPGSTVNLAYGSGGKMSAMSQTADGVTRSYTYAYDAAGNMTGVTDPFGRVTTFGYDATRNLTQIVSPAPLSAITRIAYDTGRRVTSVSQPTAAGVATTQFDYTTARHTKVTDADGRPPVDSTIDTTGRITSAVDAKGNSTSTVYNADAKVEKTTNAMAGVTNNYYVANGGDSLTRTTGPTMAESTITYNDAMLPNTPSNNPAFPYLPNGSTNPSGNASTYTYSGPGNLAATTNAMAAVAALDYNPDGTIDRATAPAGGITDYNYNIARQLTSITPPAGTSLGAQSFTYDGNGRRKTATSGKGMTTTFTYDTLDRPTGETHSDGTFAVSYAYDANGNLVSRVDASGTTAYSYDLGNRQAAKTLPGGAVLGYAYDLAGNLTSATDGGGTTLYRYDKTSRVDQLTEANGRITVFAYDADGRRTDTWNNTGTPPAYDPTGNTIIPPAAYAAHSKATFNPAGQLTRLRTTRASSEADANRVADLCYNYTFPPGSGCAPPPPPGSRPTDQRQRVTDNITGKVTTYGYDPAGRLTTATTTGGGPTYTYGYDSNGNRTSGPEGTHTYNPGNQATDGGSAYDANGNLTASVAYPTLAHNGVDQVTSITAAGQTVTAMSYAGVTNDERTAAGATGSTNGLLGVQTQTTAGVTTSFIRDPNGSLIAQRTGTDEYYYAFDGLGSIVALIDPAGTQRAAYTYDPYGANHTATGLNGTLPANPWRYAGGRLDPTGLYKYGARYYQPNLGRWTQQDSIDTLGDPNNANRYAYAGDDPVNFTDPTGRCLFGKNKDGGCRGAHTVREIFFTAAVDGVAACGAGTAVGVFAPPPGPAVGCLIGIVGGGVEGGIRGAFGVGYELPGD